MSLLVSDRARVISVLGLVQVFAWGSTYYLLAVLTDPILRDTGWPRTWVTAGISVGLLTSGLVAMRTGRLIQSHGGRPVLATAMGLIAVGLTVMALSPNVMVFLLAWVVIGTGMGAGLYDAAFSTLGRIYGQDARRAITTLTLWGGFASTVCWPISAWAVDAVGWRGTCLVYAGLHIAVLLPLCLVVLPRQSSVPVPAEAPASSSAVSHLDDPRFWLVATVVTTLSFIAALWSVHLITVMQGRGMSAAEAVALGMLIGPAQVGARLIEMALGGRFHPIWTMVAATCLVGLGLLGLVIRIPASVALIAYGAGNGVESIARGVVPLSLFGARDYPTVMGRLATPGLLAAAAAPSVGAAFLEAFGGEATLLALTCVTLIPMTCVVVLLKIGRRPRTALE